MFTPMKFAKRNTLETAFPRGSYATETTTFLGAIETVRHGYLHIGYWDLHPLNSRYGVFPVIKFVHDTVS